MKKQIFITFLLTSAFFIKGNAQDTLLFKGQLSAYTHFNPDNEFPIWSGARYIPQANYEYRVQSEKLIDFEASANIYGNVGFEPFSSGRSNGDIKPYRLWARYSTPQFELRAGLQKINFGSASLLRPLMWFDQVDPRDPLKLTDGVWGILSRYYFLNNANIWLWSLYGNKNRKGWEISKSKKNIPEFGGRFQTPVPKGEAAVTYHHRNTDCSNLPDISSAFNNVVENRFGLDTKLDIVVGCWFEASWSNFKKDLGIYSNQEIINMGIDYTFGIGNGLAVTYEHLIASYDKNPFEFKHSTTFSLLNMSYPVGMFDNISAIIYYDWTNNNAYNFLSWQKQFNKLTIFLMGYINPKNYNIPTQAANEILYAKSGIQAIVVLNH